MARNSRSAPVRAAPGQEQPRQEGVGRLHDHLHQQRGHQAEAARVGRRRPSWRIARSRWSRADPWSPRLKATSPSFPSRVARWKSEVGRRQGQLQLVGGLVVGARPASARRRGPRRSGPGRRRPRRGPSAGPSGSGRRPRPGSAGPGPTRRPARRRGRPGHRSRRRRSGTRARRPGRGRPAGKGVGLDPLGGEQVQLAPVVLRPAGRAAPPAACRGGNGPDRPPRRPRRCRRWSASASPAAAAARFLPAQLDGQVEVELLAEHRAHREQVEGGRGEQLEPAQEEQRRPAGRLDVGQALPVDLPPALGVDEGAGLHQAAQDGRGHERAALGQERHRVEGLGGQGAGHRLGQAADVVEPEGGQRHGGERFDAAQGVVRRRRPRTGRRR